MRPNVATLQCDRSVAAIANEERGVYETPDEHLLLLASAANEQRYQDVVENNGQLGVMSERATIFPPASLDEVFERLLSLSDTEFDVLVKDIQVDGFDVSKERCERLAPPTGLQIETVTVLLGALAFMYARARTLSPTEANSAVERLVGDMKLPSNASEGGRVTLTQRLLEVVRPRDEIDAAQKAARLRTGFLINAVGFASFVDARPDFGKDNATVRQLIPMVQFRITTDSETAIGKHVVFQIDPLGLTAMKDAVEAAQKKLETMLREGSLNDLPYSKSAPR